MLNNAKQSSHSHSHSHSHCPTPKTPFTKLSSLPVKSVLLYDWWLLPADGKGLAVGGFASRERSFGVRTFRSAAIVKRLDNTTLETVDGITVTINGFINKSRTHLNGFPLEVCSHFLLGFPHYWKKYADQCCCSQESVGKGVQTRISCFAEDQTSSGSHAFQPFSLEEIPMTGKRGCLVQELLDEVLQKCGYSSVQDESASKLKRSRGQYKMDTTVFIPSRSIVTRSMSRLKNIGNKQDESLSSKSTVGHRIRAELLTSKTAGKQSQGVSRLKNIGIEQDESLSSKSTVGDTINAELLTSKAAGKQSQGVGTKSGSKECQETTFPEEDKKQVIGNPNKSAFRRSSRLMNQKKPIKYGTTTFLSP